MPKRRAIDAVHWFMADLTSRVVAESGISSDRFHLGKLILQSLRDAPEFILQIDGATGASETFGSMLQRSTRMASNFRAQGLEVGDAVVLMAPNHLDLAVPFYAALYLGLIVSAVDRTLGVKELQDTFSVSSPKVIFCQSDRAPDVQVALNNLDLDSRIVTFDGGDYLVSFQEYLDQGTGDCDEDFRCADFDPQDTVGFLIATSGTTGLPKAAAISHKNFSISMLYVWSLEETFPTPFNMSLIGSPLQWLTALINFISSPIFRFTRLQTSATLTPDHCIDLIQTYRPSWAILSPTFVTSLLKSADTAECDLTCFSTILLGGSAVPPDLIEEFKTICPSTGVYNVFGMSELAGIGFMYGDQPAASSGRPAGCLQYRLIDVTTQENIYDPNTPGELWVKGPVLFKNYHNNPEATADTFAEDGWFKTGDLFYRDEHDFYYFVDRIKLMMKYKSYQISPVELELVIRQHPGVLDVAVTSVPDPECGDLPVACVIPQPGCDVAADDIKELVRENLSSSKQLHGGVVFLDKLPLTASTKVHRRLLKEMVQDMPRE